MIVEVGGRCGTKSKYARGCRCQECTAANTAWCRRRRAERALRSEDVPHGTAGGYGNWGCRCEECQEAHKIEMEAAQARRTARSEETPHGTASGYEFWNCRCEPCQQAHRRRAQRTAKRRNDAARETAHHHFHQWTGAELEIAARTDLTHREVAAMLGRTVSAVRNKRRLLREDPKTIRFAGVAR